jgi:hypothetical protein
MVSGDRVYLDMGDRLNSLVNTTQLSDRLLAPLGPLLKHPVTSDSYKICQFLIEVITLYKYASQRELQHRSLQEQC